MSGESFRELRGWAGSGASPRVWRATRLRQEPTGEGFTAPGPQEGKQQTDPGLSQLRQPGPWGRGVSLLPELRNQRLQCPQGRGQLHGISPGPLLTQPVCKLSPGPARPACCGASSLKLPSESRLLANFLWGQLAKSLL